MIRFQQEVVLVTGGSRGIGREIALVFAKAGALVALNYYQHQSAADEVVNRIRNDGGVANAFQCDVSSQDATDDLIATVREDYGRLNIVVNNAGIWKRAPLEEMEPDSWEETLRVNLTGTYNICRAAVPFLDGDRGDNIVNISSTAGQRGEAYHSHYAASKGGIISFTKSLAAELADRAIRVNCVAPGWVRTDMTGETFAGGGEREIARGVPLGRVGRPEEIAGAVVFLASPLAGYITGEILNVNGGSVLCG